MTRKLLTAYLTVALLALGVSAGVAGLTQDTFRATRCFYAPDGAVTAAGYAFWNENDCGLYVIGADRIGLTIGGVKRWDYAAAGSTLTGALTVSGATALQSTLAVTGNVAVNTDKFAVTASSGNTAIGGTLGIAGNVAVNTNKFVVTAASGNTAIAGTLGVTGDVAVNTDKFTVTAANGNTAVAGTFSVGGTTTLTGAFTAPVLATVAETTDTRVCTSADYGKTIFLSYNGAVTVTLPANGAAAGSWIDFIVTGTDSTAPTIAAATADTLIAPNDANADSVTFGSGHRIGAAVRFISTGTYWVAINLGSTTMTVNT